MSDTMTRTNITIETLTEQDTAEGHAAHIVKVGVGENGAAKVLEARIYGTLIEALCGRLFVPQRDPKRLPMCSKCKEVMGLYEAINGNEAPTS